MEFLIRIAILISKSKRWPQSPWDKWSELCDQSPCRRGPLHLRTLNSCSWTHTKVPIYKFIFNSLRESQRAGGEKAGHLLDAIPYLEGSRFPIVGYGWTKCFAKSRKANVFAAVARNGSKVLKTGLMGAATGTCGWALDSGWGSRWTATAAVRSPAFATTSWQIFSVEGASCGEFKSNHHNPALKEFTVTEGNKP